MVDWNRIGDENRYRILNRDRLNAAKQAFHEKQLYKIDPIRVSMVLKDIGACTGVIYKHVFDPLETGVVTQAVTQLWIKFDNDLVEDRYIKDESIASLDVIHPHREGVFKGAVWDKNPSVSTGC